MDKITLNHIYTGNALEILKQFPDNFIDTCISSPPYWQLRDYKVEGQLGLEPNYNEYVDKLCNIFDEVKRVLKKEGSCWVVIGDTYSTISGSMQNAQNTQPLYISADNAMKEKQSKTNLPDKCLILIPHRLAIEMTNRGWILRNIIIWHKPNALPQSVTDRFTVDFEYVFFFVKDHKYYFEQQFEPSLLESSKRKARNHFTDSKRGHVSDVAEKGLLKKISIDEIEHHCQKGRNKRTIWRIPTKGSKSNHFAVYPEELIKTPILSCCPPDGIVLDPFIGTGSTGIAALKLNRKFIGIELNKEYTEYALKNINPYLEQTQFNFNKKRGQDEN